MVLEPAFTTLKHLANGVVLVVAVASMWLIGLPFGLFLVVLGMGLMGVIPTTLLWQTLKFLSEGKWPSLSVLDGLRELGSTPWMEHPTELLGVWKILDWMPIQLGALLAVGVLFAVGRVLWNLTGWLGERIG